MRKVSVSDIIDALTQKGVVITRITLLRRAKREGWLKHAERGKRVLFSVEELPPDLRVLFEEDKDKDCQEAIPSEPQQEIPPRKEVTSIIDSLKQKSIIIMGKVGIGKSHTLEEVVKTLSRDSKVIFFKEPPTAKTVLLNLCLAVKIESGKTKEETIEKLKGLKHQEQGMIYLAIDQLEKVTPSVIQVLDSLMTISWFRFIGAGHLGSKKRYNSTWLKAKGYILRPLSRAESRALVDKLWPEGDHASKSLVVNEAKGIPGEIVRMITEAKLGLPLVEQQRYFDFTPVILVVATIGLAVRVIGYGYSSMEAYIVGGVLAAVFWGVFWIYRGYVAGWWGTKKDL